jgi:uncharacterized protein YndB with AHSA1/START domain
MVSARTSVEIDRPADDVFEFVAEFTNNPRWQRGMRCCRWTSEPPHGVGSTYEQQARFLGKDVRNSFRITALEPGRRVSFESTGGSFPIAVTRTVEPLGPGRSRFTEEVQGDAHGFYRVAEPVLQLLVRASIKRDFPRLKALLE